MPLDPHVETLLAAFAAAGRPKVWELTPAEARQGIVALAQAVDAKDVPIGRIEDGTWPAPGGPLAYRRYTPQGAAGETLPGLVYFHGGGFVIGSVETHEGLCRLLANASGARVVSVEYRLAPEHRFPAAVEDGCAAIAWVAENAPALGVDRARIAVGGDSAGATLAAVVCQYARDHGPRIALQLLLCPATRLDADTASRRIFEDGFFLEALSMEWFARHYVGSDTMPADPRLSPLLAADLSRLPEAHIHTAAFDPLRDEGKDYAGRLAQAGIAVRYTCHPGMIHHFYCMAGAIPYAHVAVASMGAAVKAALRTA
ncbi:MAG TPA: alpha/beta hydrolase [Stellaceae bacterium]|nr:alpha/beta hydrolase [Stellaceae bacterium]